MTRDFDADDGSSVDEELPEIAPQFPRVVRIAGMVQMGLGGFALVLVLVVAVVLFTNPNSTGAGSFFLALFGAPACVAIAYFGNEARVGKIRDILHIGVSLILVGVLVAPFGLIGTLIGTELLGIFEKHLNDNFLPVLFVIGSVTIAAIAIAFIRLGRAVIQAHNRYHNWKRWQDRRAFGID